MVALSAAHTIGQARYVNFRGRLYNETYRHPGRDACVVAEAAVPESGRHRGRQHLGAGLDHVLCLRQLLLPEPAGEQGPDALGPAAVQRRRLRGRTDKGVRVQHGQVLRQLPQHHGEDGRRRRVHRVQRPGQSELPEGELKLIYKE
jgi:hypothetical protein